ncbi:MAG: flagellar hook protein FlgE [Bacteroidetes bacterium]|nr:flagellar hook protein FlgE [Bacteroidota bacterium]
MALVKSLNAGVSGLNAFQTKMDVIGNNIANVETIGFKSSNISFSEMMNKNYSSNGGNPSSPQQTNQVGLGVRVGSITRDFSQGSLQATGKGTDLALQGDGFFVVKSGNENLYTRAGNFVFNKDGNLVDGDGRKVQGYQADSSGNVLGGSKLNDIQINYDDVIPPKQTENVYLAGNLDASSSTYRSLQAQNALKVGNTSASMNTDLNDLDQTNTDLVPGSEIQFDLQLQDGTSQTITYTYAAGDTMGDMINYFNNNVTNNEASLSIVDGMLHLRSQVMGNSQLAINNISVNGVGDINFPSFSLSEEGEVVSQSISSTIYDDLGNAHSLVLTFTQVDENEWSYEASFLDGENITSGQSGTVQFDEKGELITSDSFAITFNPGMGAGETTSKINLGNTEEGAFFTQFSGDHTVSSISQDGYAQGRLLDVNISSDGQIQGSYDNGNIKTLAFLALGNVRNNNGLEMVGGGLYRAGLSAGDVAISSADQMSNTSISTGFLEGSNVDLAKEFTEMITSQRAYQSNARVITTSDEMLNEAVNLKR